MITEASNLPQDDKVYLKKDLFGWRVVQPIRNENGSINWINLLIGGYRNFFILIILLIIMSFIMFAYNHDITTLQNHYSNISKDPWAFCRNMYGDNSADGVRYPLLPSNITLGGAD